MDNLKNDRYYLEKILTDLSFILAHTEGITKEEFTEQDLPKLHTDLKILL